MSENISCPVSNVTVNENQVRITAFFVFLISLSYLLAPYWAIPAFLVIDFFLRGFGFGRYSPLNALSGQVVKSLSIGNRPIDQAPKQFAAKLGFTFSGLLLIAAVFSLPEGGFVVAAVLVLFSFLESVLGICAGCYVYTITRKFLPTPDIE